MTAAFTEPAGAIGDAEPFTVNTAVHETSSSRSRRTSFGEYLAEARRAWTPDVVITPAWVRQVTGCSRWLSPRLAATLAAEVDIDAPGRESRS